MSEDTERQWLDTIEEMYGIRLAPGQLYINDRDWLYAGSEFICCNAQDGPENANQWTPQIAHFPRGLKTPALVASRRQS